MTYASEPQTLTLPLPSANHTHILFIHVYWMILGFIIQLKPKLLGGFQLGPLIVFFRLQLTLGYSILKV